MHMCVQTLRRNCPGYLPDISSIATHSSTSTISGDCIATKKGRVPLQGPLISAFIQSG